MKTKEVWIDVAKAILEKGMKIKELEKQIANLEDLNMGLRWYLCIENNRDHQIGKIFFLVQAIIDNIIPWVAKLAKNDIVYQEKLFKLRGEFSNHLQVVIDAFVQNNQDRIDELVKLEKAWK